MQCNECSLQKFIELYFHNSHEIIFPVGLYEMGFYDYKLLQKYTTIFIYIFFFNLFVKYCSYVSVQLMSQFSIVTGRGLDDRGSISNRRRNFSLRHV
jgi:hypothetical protein